MRLLKFDTIHPYTYVNKKKQEWGESIFKLSRLEYLEKLNKLRSNYSDFYTHNLKFYGWEAEEFLVNDDLYLSKVAHELWGNSIPLQKITENVKDKIRPIKDRWNKKIIRAYIKEYKPNIIFVRESCGISSAEWKDMANGAKLVNRIACPIPKGWELMYWDLVYTSTIEYKNFFELMKKNTIINPNGFDERILDEMMLREKNIDLSFIGGLGNQHFSQRTKLFEEVSQTLNFKWWGYHREQLQTTSKLYNNWQGETSGLDMFQIYKDSKIVLNDYIDIANGNAVNQRIFEVLGIGSFLLTKYSSNLEKEFPKDLFVTFKDSADCIDKCNYYLKNEAEREEIASKGQAYILSNFSYKQLAKTMNEQLKELLK
ncbi:MAG: glycosyltransferase [Bacteroidota bacterium]|jgi:hypothetical protein